MRFMGAKGASMLSRGQWLAIAGAAVVLFVLADDWQGFVGMIVFASIAVAFLNEFRSLVSRVREIEGYAVTRRDFSKLEGRIARLEHRLNQAIEK